MIAEYRELTARGVKPTVDDLTTLERWDGVVDLRTISPRHFEAAAFRVCQVLFEGHYAGAMEPMRHYIPLRKDFSNFDDVVAALRDDALRRELTDNAHRDLIASGAYDYAPFVARRRRDARRRPGSARCATPRQPRPPSRAAGGCGTRAATSAAGCRSCCARSPRSASCTPPSR